MKMGKWWVAMVGAAFVCISWDAHATSEGNEAKIAAAQKALKDSKLYPGEATGILDRETEAAVRRYQMLHSLPVTGKIDESTLQALNLPPSAYVELDRAFLAEAAPPPAPKEAGIEEATRIEALPSSLPAPVAEETFPEKKVQAFLSNYLKAASFKESRQELSYYSKPVDYLEHGPLDEEQLKEQLKKNRWQRRNLQFASLEGITPMGEDMIEVRFKVKITIRSKKKRSSSVEERLATLRKFPDGILRVVSLKDPEA